MPVWKNVKIGEYKLPFNSEFLVFATPV